MIDEGFSYHCVFFIEFLEPKLAFTGRRNNTGQLLVDIVTPYCQYPSRPVLFQVFYQEHTDQKLSCPNGTFLFYISVDVPIYLVIMPTNTFTFLTLLENMNNNISILHKLETAVLNRSCVFLSLFYIFCTSFQIYQRI